MVAASIFFHSTFASGTLLADLLEGRFIASENRCKRMADVKLLAGVPFVPWESVVEAAGLTTGFAGHFGDLVPFLYTRMELSRGAMWGGAPDPTGMVLECFAGYQRFDPIPVGSGQYRAEGLLVERCSTLGAVAEGSGRASKSLQLP
jgi:hypothetical protein